MRFWAEGKVVCNECEAEVEARILLVLGEPVSAGLEVRKIEAESGCPFEGPKGVMYVCERCDAEDQEGRG